jgi:hypothetical protein
VVVVMVAWANCIPSTRAVLSLHAEAPVANPAIPATRTAAKTKACFFIVSPFSRCRYVNRLAPVRLKTIGPQLVQKKEEIVSDVTPI